MVIFYGGGEWYRHRGSEIVGWVKFPGQAYSVEGRRTPKVFASKLSTPKEFASRLPNPESIGAVLLTGRHPTSKGQSGDLGTVSLAAVKKRRDLLE
jgi:hypothetical protein